MVKARACSDGRGLSLDWSGTTIGPGLPLASQGGDVVILSIFGALALTSYFRCWSLCLFVLGELWVARWLTGRQ
jgi:hypothetical protein